MIPGLERFREFFDGFEEHYALIGGVAAMQWLEDADMKPRATKDFDIVLIFESLNSQFLKQFWGFVKHGGYSNLQGSTGRRVYYRFSSRKETTILPCLRFSRVFLTDLAFPGLRPLCQYRRERTRQAFRQS